MDLSGEPHLDLRVLQPPHGPDRHLVLFRLRWYEHDSPWPDDQYEWQLNIGGYVEACLQSTWPPNVDAIGHELRDLHEMGGPGNFFVSYDVMCLWW